MLPSEDMARILAARRRTETEHVARDRGLLHDARATPAVVARRPAQARRSDADGRPCPPPCPERAQGVVG